MAAVDIRKFLPDADQGSVIITTRSSQVRLGQCIPLQKLEDVHERIEILSSMSRRDLSTEGTRCMCTVISRMPFAKL